MINRHAAFLTTAVALALCGCEERTPPAPAKPASTKPTAAPSAATAQPPTQPSAPNGAASSASTANVQGVSFPIPAGWKQVPPSNPMRLAEVQVPDASGDAAKACVVAFSSAGGDVQANLDRWAGQVHDASGQPVKPNVQVRTIGGMKVTIADLTGAYSGMGEPAPHANWTLRGAIIETPGSLLFVKMTGPAEQMAAAAPGFDAMIDGLKKP
jgi:hypothetical protein